MKQICEICGVEFNARNKANIRCFDCSAEVYKSVNPYKPTKKKYSPNQRIIDDVKEAEKLHLSYGKYKGRGKK